MKYVLSIAAAAILVTTFSATAADKQEAIKAPQQIMKIDIKSDSSEFDTVARKCPPFC